MLKADLHVHSRFSKDSKSEPREIVEAAVERSLDVLAVTDHDSLEGGRAVAEETAATGADLIVVPGQEVSTSQGHLLVLGVDEDAPRGPLEEVARWTHLRDGVCVAPHPFQKYRHGLGGWVLRSPEPVDGVEVCNSRRLIPLADRRAERLASRYRYPRIGGSDAHIPEMVGRVYTLVDAEPDADSVLDAIRRGDTEVREGRTPAPLFVRQLIETLGGRLTG